MTDSDPGSGRRGPRAVPPPIPQSARRASVPSESDDDDVRDLLAQIRTPRRRLWQVVGLVGGLSLLIALLAMLLDSDEVDVPPGPISPESRLLSHLAGDSATAAADRFELTPAGGSPDGAVTLFHVRDRREPSSTLRACAVLPNEVSCPHDPSEYAAVLADLGPRVSAESLDEARWVETAAWVLGVERPQVYRGDAVGGNPTPTTVVLALSPAPLPGLDTAGLSETARAALDSLRPGDGLVVLGEHEATWSPMLVVEDAGDWVAAESLVATLDWSSASAAVGPTPSERGDRRLQLVAILAANGELELEVDDMLAAAGAAPGNLGISAVTVGMPPAESLIREVFQADGRIYALPGANGLAEVAGREVARIAGCRAPLAPPQVARTPDGGVAVRLFAPTEGGWRRHQLQVSARGAVTERAVRRFAHDACSATERAAPVPELQHGEWLAGTLTSADPTGPDSRPVDRVRLSLGESRQLEIEAESGTFRPRLSVRAEGPPAAPLATDTGEDRARVELDLSAGQYRVTIQSDDGSTGAYRVRANERPERRRQRSARRAESETRDPVAGASDPRADRQTPRPTAPTPTTPATEEALSDNDLRSTMRPHIPGMTECAGTYRGVVSLRFTVERGGQVRDATAEGDGLSSRAAECLCDLVRRVRFSGYSGPLVEATYFVVF